MAPGLVTVKCVPEREHHKPSSRLGTTVIIRSLEKDVVTDGDEVEQLNRGVVFILFVGLLPIVTWMFIHIFFPTLLSFELEPALLTDPVCDAVRQLSITAMNS